MQLLRRGGHPHQPKPKNSEDVDRQIEALRKEAADKIAKATAEGKATAAKAKSKAKSKAKEEALKVGGSQPDGNGSEEGTRAGWQAPPVALADFAPTDQEQGIEALMKGESVSWTENFSDPPKRTASFQSTLPAVQSRQQRMQQIEALGLIPPVPSLLGTYLRNRLLHVEGREPDSTDVQLALEDALHKGSPELLIEAESYLSKVGSHGDRVTLTSTVWTAEAPGTAALTWKDCTWDVLDYGDQLPCLDGRRAILEPQQEPQPEDEPRQCLVLHVAAALLYAVTHRLPTHAEVVQRAHLLRDETISAARAAQEVLGDAPAEISRAENDLRIFIHDTLFFGHDKDYRSLAAFPPADLDSVTLHVMRLDSWKRPTVESIAGLVSQDEQVAWLLVYDGHMRLLVPRSNLPRDINARRMSAAGWEVHLEAAHHQQEGTLVKCSLCPRCKQEDLRRTGTPSNVLGLYPMALPPPPYNVGDCPWELAEPDSASFDLSDVWLFFRGQESALTSLQADTPLFFLELAPHSDHMTPHVLTHGVVGLTVSPDYGHDMRRGRDRALVRAAIRLLRPRHLWLSFSTAPPGAWDLACARHALSPHPSSHGKFSFQFALSRSLFQTQLGHGADAHILHPLTSAVWRDPLAIQVLSPFQRVRLDFPAKSPLLLRTSLSLLASSLRSLSPLACPPCPSLAALLMQCSAAPEARFAPGRCGLRIAPSSWSGGGGGGEGVSSGLHRAGEHKDKGAQSWALTKGPLSVESDPAVVRAVDAYFRRRPGARA